MTLDISSLLRKFKSYGIPGRAFGINLSIPKNRLLLGVLEWNSLQEYVVNATVPQCSIFGPIFFYYTLMSFLAKLPVIFLSIMLVLLNILSLIKYLIC